MTMLPSEALQGLTVPTLANAIETFGVVAPNAGYNRQPVQCHFPEFGMLIARAVTLTTSTDTPSEQAPERIDDPAYWRWLDDRHRELGPLVAVLQDIDEPAGGAMWGEWNANVHRRLGCVGTITHGAVRDLDALERLGFHAFSTSVSVGHGYGAFTGYGETVTVAGVTITTGDLLVADRHGFLRIPAEIPLDELAESARTIDALETEIFRLCQSPSFTIDALTATQASVLERWPRGTRSRPV
jgi:4-hydroxy-4-methyl-2-oxoglutarate aldolase